MAKYLVDEQDIKEIANAIRRKNKNAKSLSFPYGIVQAINALPDQDGEKTLNQVIDKSIESLEILTDTIGAYAFCYCSKLTKISLPNAKIIKWNAFGSCANLKTILLPNNNACIAESDPVISANARIYVPTALVEVYKNAPNWSKYANQFRSID